MAEPKENAEKKGILGFLKAHQTLRYVLSSISSWVVDNGLYYLFLVLLQLGSLPFEAMSVAAQVAARVLSSFYNYNVNYYFVFGREEQYLPALKKYYLLCVPQAFISTVLVTALVSRLSIASPGLATVVKVIVETVLFCISYVIQNKWVFRKKKAAEMPEDEKNS